LVGGRPSFGSHRRLFEFGEISWQSASTGDAKPSDNTVMAVKRMNIEFSFLELSIHSVETRNYDLARRLP
jgi:hypothetical protein